MLLPQPIAEPVIDPARLEVAPGMPIVLEGRLYRPLCVGGAVQQAYESITGVGLSVPLSVYYLTHWHRELGDTLTLFLAQVRRVALYDAEPAIRHPDLARWTPWSERTIQRIVRFWRDPACHRDLGIRGDLALVWETFHCYLPELAEDTAWHGRGSAPYRYRPLLGDRVHPKHLPIFSDLASGAGQKEIFLPEIEGLRPISQTAGKGRQNVGLSHPAESSSDPAEPVRVTECRAYPPENGPICRQNVGLSETHGMAWHGHEAMAMPQTVPESVNQGQPPAFEAFLAGMARPLLLRKGVKPTNIERLLAHPDGPLAAITWLDWEPAIGPRWGDRAACLLRCARGYAEGSVRDQQPPREVLDQLEERVQRHRQLARTASKVAAVAPAPVATDGSAEALWKNFLRLVHRESTLVHGLLRSHARSVSRDGEALVVTVPEDRLTQLERERDFLLRLARKANPACPELRFITPKGGR